MAAGFQKIDEAGDVAFHIGQRIFRGVAHAGLGGEMDDPVEAVLREAGLHRLLIGKIFVNEHECRAVFGRLLALHRETILLELAPVTIVNRIESNALIAALDEGTRRMKTDEAGAARDHNFR